MAEGMTDYQQGSVIFEMDVTTLANGFTKATCQGLEENDRDPSVAINKLQERIQQALISGDLRPEM